MPNTAVIVDSSGSVVMVIHPDREVQLNDSAFNPKGCVQVRIARKDYEAVRIDPISKDAALLKSIAPEIAKTNAKLAGDMTARAEALETAKADYEAELAAQKAAWDALSEEEKRARLSDEEDVIRK